MSILKISVEDFCTPITKTGSLNQRSQRSLPVGLQERADELLLDIQDRQVSIEGYRKNFFIYRRLPHDDLSIELSARCGGIYAAAAEPVLENIIPSYNLNALHQELYDNPQHPQLLEIKTAAWLYARSHDRAPRCQLLLVSAQDPEEYLIFSVSYDERQHSQWLRERQDYFINREKLARKRERSRREIGHALQFPFSAPRPGQNELMAAVEEIVSNGAQGILQAPTGLGKTAGVLLPALKEALQNWKQVIYLTPKNSQQQLVLQTLELLRDCGNPITGLIITAKERSCLKKEVICNPKYCEYARKYYDKLRKDGVVEKIVDEGLLNPATFREYGQRYEVCPFELALDATAHVDVIIGDYNYAISPKTALKRYFDEDGKADKVNLVVDEAHNLHNRAMDHYSPELDEQELTTFTTTLPTLPTPFGEQALSLTQEIISFIRNARPDETIASPVYNRDSEDHYGHSMLLEFNYEKLHDIEQRLNKVIARYSETRDYLSPSDPLVQLCGYLGDYCAVTRMQGDHFYHTYNVNPAGDKLVITCADPSKYLRDIWEMCASTTIFSATIKPFDFYASIIGFDQEKVISREFSSPFDPTNRKLLVVPQVSTLYNERGAYYDRIAEAIERILPRRMGNYFIFFSSFVFLQKIAQRLKLPGFEILSQVAAMPRDEAEALLQKMRAASHPCAVLAVQGGIFSEGIDLPGEAVIGSIIVGPGLPAFSLERNCIREYCEEHYGEGFNYAYTYPAMAKTIQAAGRVIRSGSDRGLIVLLGRRFATKNYAHCMPSDWYRHSVEELISNNLLGDIDRFWAET